MCSHFIDQNSGHLAGDYSERIIGITPTSLKKVPVRVFVAAGLDKKYATQAALNGGCISHLVIDEDLAKFLISV